jgi:hypothetical protein
VGGVVNVTRAILIDENCIDIFSSAQALSSYIEHDSFSGSEVAFFESGERLDLVVKKGRKGRDLFGREYNQPDFLFIEAIPTGDFDAEFFIEKLNNALKNRNFPSKRHYNLQELTDAAVSIQGLNC